MKSDIQRGWLLSVIEEYESIREAYPALSTLQVPALVVEPDLTRTLGYWDRELRRIIFAGLLFERHAWGDVIAVLKHEMAHQIVDEVYVVRNETDHGPAFRDACELLGISAEATMPLAASASSEDAPRRRIEKLLALGQSSNRHEAESALAKAHELGLQYNIQMVEREFTRAYRFRKAGRLYRRIPAHVWAVANLVNEFYFVHYIAHVYQGKHQTLTEGYRQIELYGTPENLDMAEYVFDFLLRQGDSEWVAFRAQHPAAKGQRAKASFLRGVFEGFQSKLEAERHTLAVEKALVWKGDPELDAFYRQRNPRVSSRSIGAMINPDAHAAGIEIGAQMQVLKPITNSSIEAGVRLLR
jgi:hypothetical protein